MNLTSLILLLCVCVNAGLGVFVFRRRHSRPVHFAFAALVFATAFWNLSHLTISLSDRPAVLVLVGRLAFAVGAFLGASYLVLTWTFPETSHPVPSRRTLIAALGASLGFVVLSCTPYVQAGVLLTEGGKYPVFGPLFPLYALHVMTLFVWATANLVWARRRTPSGHERMQVTYALAGFVGAFLVAITTQFGMPLVAPMSDYYLLGGSGTLAWSVLTFYAITRYRLMDIGVAFRNVLVKLLLAAVVTFLVLVPYLVNRLTQGQAPFFTELLIVMTVIAGLTLGLPRIQRGITLVVDQFLFRGRYDHGTALVRFGDRLQRTHGRENIAGVAAREIPIILKAEGGAVYLPGEDGADYVLAAGEPAGLGSRPAALPGDDPILAAVRQRPTRLIKDEVSDARPRAAWADGVVRSLERLGAAVVWPLLCQDRLLGILVLGQKRQDSVFSSDDMELVGALASQAAFALDNTQLYEEAVAARRRYETMLGHMQRGVLAVDTRLRVVTLNHPGAVILGLQEGDVAGLPLADLVPEFAALAANALREQRDLPATESALALKRGVLPCECEISLISDARNRLTSAMLVFQDLTERRRSQEQMRRMDRLASVGTLAAGLAHEIKNPLVSIQAFIQLLPERYADSDFRDGFGGVVRDEVSRINKLVLSLLEFARPRPSQIGPVNLHELLDRSLTLLDSELRKAAITVVRNDDPELPVIHGDAEKLIQVIFNLLRNAIEATTGETRRIEIGTTRQTMAQGGRQHEAVRLTIRDTGEGIDPERLPSIFDPFFSTKANGSGLGLSICHTILEEHGAQIEVESKPGEGTAFAILLPRNSALETGPTTLVEEVPCWASS